LAQLIFASALGRHARRYEWLRALLFRLEALIVQLFWSVFRALPPERAAGLGRFAVGLLGPRSAKAALVKANLSIAFPKLDPAAIDDLAGRTWRNIGLVFGEYAHLHRIARVDGDPRLEIVDHCGLDVYRLRERQAIFLGAHLSNWEIMALALGREGVPLLALHAPLQNPYLDVLMDRARQQVDCGMLRRGRSMRDRAGMSFAQVASLMHQLRNGGSLGLLLDLWVKDGVPLSFFGQPMRTSLTPARLAERYGCDIVPVRTERLGAARFRLTVYPPLIHDAVCADEEARAIGITKQMIALMEQWIGDQPDEWMCASRRWDKSVYRSLGIAHR
jgi:KDO2-lipid IV(A) lauroyltransferase